MPPGNDVTLPPGVLFTVSKWEIEEKEADTFFAELKVSEQVPVPEHPPPVQPEKEYPDDAIAVSVTAVPAT